MAAITTPYPGAPPGQTSESEPGPGGIFHTAAMSTESIITLTVGVFMACASGASAIVVAGVGWLMKRSVEAADKNLAELPEIRRELGSLTTKVALVEQSVTHHAEKQDEFCDRLSAVEYVVRQGVVGKVP